MLKKPFPRWAGIVTALVAAVMFAPTARAQTPPAPPAPLDITDCALLAMPLGTEWNGFCSPVWKLPVGTPELGFSTPPNPPNSGNPTMNIVQYDRASGLLTIVGVVHAAYFRNTGGAQFDYTDSGLATVVV